MADLRRRPSWTLGTGLSRRGHLALHSHMVSAFPCSLWTVGHQTGLISAGIKKCHWTKRNLKWSTILHILECNLATIQYWRQYLQLLISHLASIDIYSYHNCWIKLKKKRSRECFLKYNCKFAHRLTSTQYFSPDNAA